MTISYIVDESLYLNITNRCTNDCCFCIRRNADGAYGSDSLWLEYEPTIKEICDNIFSQDLSAFKEIVFCGYGEPLMRFDAVIEISRQIKAKYPALPIRINTNGQGELINYKGISKHFKGLIDYVSISLNAANAEDYQSICQCVYGEEAFPAIIEFAKDCKNYVPKVVFSIVDIIKEEEIEKCKEIANNAGVTLRIRHKI